MVPPDRFAKSTVGTPIAKGRGGIFLKPVHFIVQVSRPGKHRFVSERHRTVSLRAIWLFSERAIERRYRAGSFARHPVAKASDALVF